MPKLFGTFGVRGVANVDLTPELAFQLGISLATYLGNRGRVAVGYDNRTSSEMLENACISGLLSGGCEVLRLGMVPTPVLSFGVTHFDCSAGVIITASHNPPQWNGIKFWKEDGGSFPHAEELEIEKIIEQRSWKMAEWQRVGRTRRADAIQPYLDSLLERVQPLSRELKVVVDCANATGSLVTPILLRRLGCRVISLNCQIDGTFPGRMPEPTPENLQGLSSAVRTYGADVGLAQDGDADRAVVVNEKGEVMVGDRTFALVAQHYLRGRKAPKIVTTVATSTVMDEVARRLGGTVVRTRVGEPEIVAEIRARGGDLGGEENGGTIFPAWSLARDGIMTIAQFVSALAESGLKVTELDATLPKFYQLKKKVECPNELKVRVLEKLKEEFSGYRLNTIDGLRIDFADGWLLLRPSGTEPIFRCFSEATTQERAQELVEMGLNKLRETLKILGA
jgi:phosphomannomutase/phosphoglucomutase